MGFSRSSLEIILGTPEVREKMITTLSKENLSFTEFLQAIVAERKDTKQPFYILDLGAVAALVDRWSDALPMVQPFYAVKCNPDPILLPALAALGCNFDCASKDEIESILSLGVSPDRIIFANPCKTESHIKYAASVGVNLTTFDSKDELVKIQKWHPKCSLLVRLKAPDDSGARWPLSSKYGALPEEIESLLEAAQAMHLNVAGVSFHIGSASTNALAYQAAIEEAKNAFETASRLGMPRMHVLNIGGGFIASQYFEKAATVIKSAVQAYFPDDAGLTIIAEPGRFIAETVFTLVTNIIGKRVRGDSREYWISEGIYGSFNCLYYDHATLTCTPFAYTSCHANPTCNDAITYSSTVFGPTCDSFDTVLKGYHLPELQVDDWLVFHNMGAYTTCCGTNFNGFKTTSVVFTFLAYMLPFA